MDIIRVLAVDDDKGGCQQVFDLLNDTEVGGCKISVDMEQDFEKGKERLRAGDYDVVILDLYKGAPSEENKDLIGTSVLDQIKATAPIAVIFYTGLTKYVEDLKSDVVRVVSKTTGQLDVEFKLLIETGIPIMKKKLIEHVDEILREYYWDFINKNGSSIQNTNDKALSEYSLLRRLAATLTRSGVAKIFGNAISADNVHPLEFYIVPPLPSPYFQTGDILKKSSDSSFHVVLTPSCDFANGGADYILLAAGTPLKEIREYIAHFARASTATKNELLRIIGSRKDERHFFLPRISFISMPDLVVDFQNVTNHLLTGFNGYEKVATIDDPFAQDMLAKFIRNKNRPGAPNLDGEYIIQSLTDDLAAERAAQDQNEGGQ